MREGVKARRLASFDRTPHLAIEKRIAVIDGCCTCLFGKILKGLVSTGKWEVKEKGKRGLDLMIECKKRKRVMSSLW